MEALSLQKLPQGSTIGDVELGAEKTSLAS